MAFSHKCSTNQELLFVNHGLDTALGWKQWIKLTQSSSSCHIYQNEGIWHHREIYTNKHSKDRDRSTQDRTGSEQSCGSTTTVFSLLCGPEIVRLLNAWNVGGVHLICSWCLFLLLYAENSLGRNMKYGSNTGSFSFWFKTFQSCPQSKS